jgi:hypothetical protein
MLHGRQLALLRGTLIPFGVVFDSIFRLTVYVIR